MGKWPRLDKIEMIDGPIDKQSYEHQIKNLLALPRKIQQ